MLEQEPQYASATPQAYDDSFDEGVSGSSTVFGAGGPLPPVATAAVPMEPSASELGYGSTPLWSAPPSTTMPHSLSAEGGAQLWSQTPPASQPLVEDDYRRAAFESHQHREVLGHTLGFNTASQRDATGLAPMQYESRIEEVNWRKVGEALEFAFTMLLFGMDAPIEVYLTATAIASAIGTQGSTVDVADAVVTEAVLETLASVLARGFVRGEQARHLVENVVVPVFKTWLEELERAESSHPSEQPGLEPTPAPLRGPTPVQSGGVDGTSARDRAVEVATLSHGAGGYFGGAGGRLTVPIANLAGGTRGLNDLADLAHWVADLQGAVYHEYETNWPHAVLDMGVLRDGTPDLRAWEKLSDDEKWHVVARNTSIGAGAFMPAAPGQNRPASTSPEAGLLTVRSTGEIGSPQPAAGLGSGTAGSPDRIVPLQDAQLLRVVHDYGDESAEADAAQAVYNRGDHRPEAIPQAVARVRVLASVRSSPHSGGSGSPVMYPSYAPERATPVDPQREDDEGGVIVTQASVGTRTSAFESGDAEGYVVATSRSLGPTAPATPTLYERLTAGRRDDTYDQLHAFMTGLAAQPVDQMGKPVKPAPAPSTGNVPRDLWGNPIASTAPASHTQPTAVTYGGNHQPDAVMYGGNHQPDPVTYGGNHQPDAVMYGGASHGSTQASTPVQAPPRPSGPIGTETTSEGGTLYRYRGYTREVRPDGTQIERSAQLEKTTYPDGRVVQVSSDGHRLTTEASGHYVSEYDKDGVEDRRVVDGVADTHTTRGPAGETVERRVVDRFAVGDICTIAITAADGTTSVEVTQSRIATDDGFVRDVIRGVPQTGEVNADGRTRTHDASGRVTEYVPSGAYMLLRSIRDPDGSYQIFAGSPGVCYLIEAAYADGSVFKDNVQTYHDGTKVTWSNASQTGIMTKTLPDGTTFVDSGYGRIVETRPDGHVIARDATGGVVSDNWQRDEEPAMTW